MPFIYKQEYLFPVYSASDYVGRHKRINIISNILEKLLLRISVRDYYRYRIMLLCKNFIGVLVSSMREKSH